MLTPRPPRKSGRSAGIGPLEDVFAVQTELAQELAGKIGGFTGTVLAADKNAAMRKRPSNLTAYDLYLMGIEAKNREDKASVEEAINLFKRSIDIDPRFARAWTMLGSAYAISTRWADHPDEVHQLSMKKRSPALSNSILWMPRRMQDWALHCRAIANPERGKAEFEEALRLNPNSADVLTRYSYWAASFGLAEKGADMAEKAIRLASQLLRLRQSALRVPHSIAADRIPGSARHS